MDRQTDRRTDGFARTALAKLDKYKTTSKTSKHSRLKQPKIFNYKYNNTQQNSIVAYIVTV